MKKGTTPQSEIATLFAVAISRNKNTCYAKLINFKHTG